jgi:hypothetical protein
MSTKLALRISLETQIPWIEVKMNEFPLNPGGGLRFQTTLRASLGVQKQERIRGAKILAPPVLRLPN